MLNKKYCYLLNFFEFQIKNDPVKRENEKKKRREDYLNKVYKDIMKKRSQMTKKELTEIRKKKK